jgi:predicted nuclease of restriction endonuclease-like RecB superfamily
LIQRVHGEEVVPRRLPLQADTHALAEGLIALFRAAQGRTRGEIEGELQVLEGDHTDYRVKRGLAHLLVHDFSAFEVSSPVEPAALRQRVFALSATSVPSPQRSQATLTAVADGLSHELGRDIVPAQVRAWLYADLPEAHVLTSFDPPTPEGLLARYNLAQAQGALYRASHVVITAHRNDPGEYKLLFRYLKLFGLMAYIEGDADHGFTLTIDGPASLFTPSPRYGLALAKLLPALLHVTRWHLTATLVPRRRFSATSQGNQFTLEASCGLVSHYPPGKPYDSILEQAFAERWTKTPTPWRLEREVDLIPLPGSVMVPDFRLVHPDGRSVLLEIVGYWRPEYLRKKFAQVRRAGRTDVILAVSERLNLERAGVRRADLPARLVWFKDRLLPKAVLDVLETYP